MKQVDALSPLLFNFARENTIRRGTRNLGLDVNDTDQILNYVDDINRQLYQSNRKYADMFLYVCRDIDLAVDIEKTKYMNRTSMSIT